MRRFKRPKPNVDDFNEIARLQYRIATGQIEPPEVRLARQLEALFTKWAERGVGKVEPT